MDTLRFEHLMRIAATDIPAPEDVVKEIASKFYDRYMTFAKGFAAFAATILATLILPWFGQGKDFFQFEISWYCALVCLVCSLLSLLRSAQYSRRYANALRVVDRLRSIRTLLRTMGY
jgi:cobalamin biosynthesis protein CobD/CbiB